MKRIDRMKRLNVFRYAVHIGLASCLFTLFSCTPSEDLYAGGGIGGSGVISTGTITELGSIWVNGVEFDTHDAAVYVNGERTGTGDQGVAENLSPGRVVSVIGTLGQEGLGEAGAVHYFPTSVGPVLAVDQIGDDFIFYLPGQEILANSQTLVNGVSLESIEIDNLIEVSGLIDDRGVIQATYILRKAESAGAADLLSLTGVIGNNNKPSKTLRINSLTVDYKDAELLDSSASIENGAWIYISGRFHDGNPVFQAEMIRPFNRIGDNAGKDIEIEGIVGGDPLGNRFRVEGHLIEFTAETRFRNGTEAEIQPGSIVEVEGFSRNGILMAEQIRFQANFRMEGDLFQKNAVNRTLMLRGLEDLTIRTNELTRFQGTVHDFEDLSDDTHLIIKGRVIDGTDFMATQVIAPGMDKNEIMLQAPVSSKNDPAIHIGVLTIDADLFPSDGFFTEDHTSISKDTFFNLVETGTRIEVKGERLADDSIAWISLSLAERL